MLLNSTESIAPGVYPTLPLQQQLWLMQQMAPDASVCNIPARLSWRGPLCLSAFQEALFDLVCRHPYLRTTVDATETGTLLQNVHPPQSVPLHVFDIRHVPADEREGHLMRILRPAAETPISEDTFPWIRATIVRLDDECYEMALVVSHLACDGLSMGILCKEVLQAYEARRQSKSPTWSHDIPDTLLQDISSKAGPASFDFATSHATISFPYDHNPPIRPSYRGGRVDFQLSEEESNNISALSRQFEVSPFVTWLALLQWTLYRYTSVNEVAVDILKAGREGQLRKMVGPFIETSILQTALDPQQSFSSLLLANRQSMELADECTDENSASLPQARSRIMLDYQSGLRPMSLSDGVEVHPAEWDNGAAIAEFCFGIRKHRRRFCGHIKFDAELYDQGTVENALSHLRHTLAQVTSQPEVPLASIESLPPVELKIMRQVNATQRDRNASRFIDEQFDLQAADQAERLAMTDYSVLCSEPGATTYRDLQQRVLRIAAQLQNAGVQPGDRVAVWMPRSIDSLATMFAVLKCGAAYVPIDPQNPIQRQQLILRSADVRCVVTDGHGTEANRDNLSRDVTVIDVRDDSDVGEFRSPAGRDPDDIAYVLFTSGSTGTPKGVEVTHNNVTNFFLAMDQLQGSDQPGTDQPGTWLAVTNLAFDISVYEVLWTLCRGFHVIVDPSPLGDHGTESHGSMAERIHKHQVTHFQCTPALMQMLLQDHPCRQALQSLRKIFVGGEAMPESLSVDLHALASGDVYNMYGPTETTIWSLVWQLDGTTPVSIGRPIANTEIYVLSPNGERSPIGVTGELYIGGEGVARGYFRNPQQTNQRFIEHPKWGRLFRTGDLVQMQADGSCLFLGRNDQQVKLHGHRFELGDVETQLRRHTAIRDAACLLIGEKSDQRLVAAVCQQGKQDTAPAELVGFLREHLPSYMIPDEFVTIDSMPLNASQKIDRSRLASYFGGPNRPQIKKAAPNAAPEPTAASLRPRLEQLVCQELGLGQLNTTSAWHQLGIGSLDIVRIVARIEQEFGIQVPIIDFFRSASVEDTLDTLSARLERVGPPEFEEGVL